MQHIKFSFFKIPIAISLAIGFLSSTAQTSELQEKISFFQKNQQFDSALLYLNDLIIAAEIEGNDSLLSSSYIQCGFILCRMHRCGQGKGYFEKSLQIGLNNNAPTILAKSYMSLGNYFLLEKQYDSAIVMYDKSITFFSKVDDQSNIMSVLGNKAYLYFENGRIKDAEDELDRAISYHKKASDSLKIIESLINFSLIYKSRNLNEKAIASLMESIQYEPDRFTLAKIHLNLGKNYWILENYHSAANHLLIYDSLIDQHLNRDYASELSELAEKYKTAEIERDNALKQAEIEESKKQLTLLYALSAFLILAFISVYLFLNQRRKRLKLASEKAIKDLLQEQEAKTTYALLEGQDKERKRIAAELHDSLGSILVTLNMYADTLISKKPEEMEKLAKKISETAQLANEETRKISHSLDSGMLKHFGLEAAIHQLSEAVSAARNIKFELTIQLHDALSTETSLEVYRIIQELVNNTLKHAQCSTIRLDLTHIKGSLNLIYEDNGIGFKKEEIQFGMGLKNIENRVSKLDGELTIDSSPEKGSAFIVEILTV